MLSPPKEKNKIESVAKKFNAKQWWPQNATVPHIGQNIMKAATLRSFIYWISEVCLEDKALAEENGAMRAALFRSFVEGDLVMRQASRILSEDQHEQLCKHIMDALVANRCLQCTRHDLRGRGLIPHRP